MFLFKTFSYFSFRWLLILFLCLVSPTKEQSSLTAPIEWPFNTTNFAGPDGPWTIINIQVGWPSKSVSVFPGRNPATLVITSNVCFQQGANCSNLGAGFYDPTSEAPGMTTNDFNVSKDIVPGWNANLTYPMQVDGPVKHTLERITVLAENGSPQYVDNQSMLLSDGMAIRYAGGIQISLEIGILSLASQVTLIPPPSGGPSWYTYTPLSFLGRDSTPETPISSQSWGLHMGSAQCNIPGSLYFGGYDQNRLLGAPGIFDDSATPVTGISINSTIEAFPSTNNLLDAASSSSSSNAFLSIIPEPALPYLYLPPAVCTSIASRLPLNYNAGLQLYTWDLTHPSLPTLLTSLSTLQFTFTNSSGTSTTVSIPLALLNLTLTPPLVPETTPYFPCRPYSPENDTGQYYLGRAFLQGAFIGQNWDSGAYFLAQTPGPNLPRSQVVVIGPNDKTISAINDAPAWEDTWKGILSKDGVVQLPSASHNISSHNSSTSSSPPNPTGSSGKRPFLSVGAKAAIGVCCAVVGFALIIVAVLGILRKRNRLRKKVSQAMECSSAQDNSQRAWQKPELNGQGKVEMEAAALARELTGHGIHEADASEFVHEIGERGMVGISYEVEGQVGRSELR